MSLRAPLALAVSLAACGSAEPTVSGPTSPVSASSRHPAPISEPDSAPLIVLDGTTLHPAGFEMQWSEGQWSFSTLPSAAPGFAVTLASPEPAAGLVDGGQNLTAYKPKPGGGTLHVGFTDQERTVKIEILTFAPGTSDKRGTCSFRFDVKGYAADTKLEASGVARQVPCYAIE